MLEIIEQMPTASENYLVEWDDDLAAADGVSPADTIASWSVSASSPNFTVSKVSNTDNTTTMRVSGGVIDIFYEITIVIVTVGGNTIPKIIPFHCMKVFVGN